MTDASTHPDPHHQAGTPTDVGDTGVEVVLSREELRAAVVHQPTERVRVRREVVTEEVSVTVAVRREVLRVEREEIAPGTRSPDEASGPFAAGGDGAWEMVLHEERPVVGVEVVPVERVRVEVVERHGVQEVQADLAVEHVEVDGPGLDGAGGVAGAGAADAQG